MSDVTQQYIDNLITFIDNAEDPGVVTNKIVAAVLNHLNNGLKNLLIPESPTSLDERLEAVEDAILGEVDVPADAYNGCYLATGYNADGTAGTVRYNSGYTNVFRLAVYDVSQLVGKTLILNISSNSGTTMAGAWFSSAIDIPTTSGTNSNAAGTNARIGTSTYSGNDSNVEDFSLVVPQGAKYLALSLAKAANVSLVYMSAGQRLNNMEAEIQELQDAGTFINRAHPNLFRSDFPVVDTYDANEDTYTIPTTFDVPCIVKNAIITEQGKPGAWGDTHNTWGAVAITPATTGKVYVIYTPYLGNWGNLLVGVIADNNKAYGSGAGVNIAYKDQRYIIATASYTGLSRIIGIAWQLCSSSRVTPWTEPIMAECYEFDTVAEAMSFVRERKTKEEHTDKVNEALPQNIDITDAIWRSNVGTFSTMLKNKSFMIFGDSISADKGWSEILANDLRWSSVYNCAIGGALIDGMYHRTNPAGHYDLVYQILHSPASIPNDIMLTGVRGDDYTSTEGGESVTREVWTKRIDYVSIFIGYNNTSDFTGANNNLGDWDTVVGTAWTSLAPDNYFANGDIMDFTDNNFGDGWTTKFSNIYSAVKFCLMLLKTKVIKAKVNVGDKKIVACLDYRFAKIVWTTPIQAYHSDDVVIGGLDRLGRIKRIEDACAKMCALYGIPVIRGRTMSGISAAEESSSENVAAGGKFLRDGTHLNEEGYKLVAKMHLHAFLGGGINADWYEQGSSSVTVVDNLTSTSTTSALSAKQGKALNESKANKVAVVTDAQPSYTINVTRMDANAYAYTYDEMEASGQFDADFMSAFAAASGIGEWSGLTPNQFNTLNEAMTMADVNGWSVSYTVSGGYTFLPGICYQLGAVNAVSFALGAAVGGVLNEYAFSFTCQSDYTVLTLPSGVAMGNGLNFDSDRAEGRKFIVKIIDGIATYIYA